MSGVQRTDDRMKWMLSKYRNSIWLLFNHKRIRLSIPFRPQVPFSEPFSSPNPFITLSTQPPATALHPPYLPTSTSFAFIQPPGPKSGKLTLVLVQTLFTFLSVQFGDLRHVHTSYMVGRSPSLSTHV